MKKITYSAMILTMLLSSGIGTAHAADNQQGDLTIKNVDTLDIKNNEFQTTSLIIAFQDMSGNDITPSLTIPGRVGAIYDATNFQKDILGYHLVAVSGELKGTLGYEDTKIIFQYDKDENAGTVTVKYVDENGNRLYDDVTFTGLNGESYKTNQLFVKDYTFDHVEGNINGVYTTDSQTVTYVYKKTQSDTNPVEPSEPIDPIEPNIPVDPIEPNNPETETDDSEAVNDNMSNNDVPEVPGKSAQSKPSSSNVSKQSEKTLPQTGESSVIGNSASVAGVLVLLSASYWVFRNKRLN
ncbi:hypothetical protein RD055328_12700 [Companilactobacillus sp. RD055328]|uniref:MucBP domain-containing protein n=1 Tax=Companilactobacillus sp. RD055328 TaxID=2916634 RepID=UPI001FC89C9E|nr:MucBP domain-containing protein [Companilactobacillus sp. RD055328]GKQ43347.1 hypothetical protein RD055328_12700 [Companilactobacillus sp. RD055328]